MSRRSLVAAVLVASLSVSSVHAQQTLRESIARAGAEAGAQVAPQGGRIPPGYLWSGVGLLAAGGVYLVYAATTDSSEYTCIGAQCVSGDTLRTTGFILGGALAGTGAFLLIKGMSKRNQSAPSVTFVPGGVAIEKKLSF